MIIWFDFKWLLKIEWMLLYVLKNVIDFGVVK